MGDPPQLSPLSGAYLLIVIGEPENDAHKEKILDVIKKGLSAWDKTDNHVDLLQELKVITNCAPPGEESKGGERLIQFATENLVTEILIHPQVNTLQQCMRNMLGTFTKHRHIIHAGYAFSGNGSWILQDGTFSYQDFVDVFDEYEVQRVMRCYENSISIHITCSQHGDWNQDGIDKEQFSRLCQVVLNPEVKEASNSELESFITYIGNYLDPIPILECLPTSEVVGSIRFSHPTLYIFPGGQGDSALFGINGFNMLIDGGFYKKSCFWGFTRHLDRLDAILCTRLNEENTQGISTVMKRKIMTPVFPQIGHFFGNFQSQNKQAIEPSFKDDLIVDIRTEGSSIIDNLSQFNIVPQTCYSDTSCNPINLYHKVGHGKLDMYVLNPSKDSHEVRELTARLQKNIGDLGNTKSGMILEGKDIMLPLMNMVSICALLIWYPANPDHGITRLLFPGSTPQNKIFLGLEKLKNLECLMHPNVSQTFLSSQQSSKRSGKDHAMQRESLKDKKKADRTDKVSRASDKSRYRKLENENKESEKGAEKEEREKFNKFRKEKINAENAEAKRGEAQKNKSEEDLKKVSKNTENTYTGAKKEAASHERQSKHSSASKSNRLTEHENSNQPHLSNEPKAALTSKSKKDESNKKVMETRRSAVGKRGVKKTKSSNDKKDQEKKRANAAEAETSNRKVDEEKIAKKVNEAIASGLIDNSRIVLDAKDNEGTGDMNNEDKFGQSSKPVEDAQVHEIVPQTKQEYNLDLKSNVAAKEEDIITKDNRQLEEKQPNIALTLHQIKTPDEVDDLPEHEIANSGDNNANNDEELHSMEIHEYQSNEKESEKEPEVEKISPTKDILNEASKQDLQLDVDEEIVDEKGTNDLKIESPEEKHDFESVAEEKEREVEEIDVRFMSKKKSESFEKDIDTKDIPEVQDQETPVVQTTEGVQSEEKLNSFQMELQSNDMHQDKLANQGVNLDDEEIQGDIENVELGVDDYKISDDKLADKKNDDVTSETTKPSDSNIENLMVSLEHDVTVENINIPQATDKEEDVITDLQMAGDKAEEGVESDQGDCERPLEEKQKDVSMDDKVDAEAISDNKADIKTLDDVKTEELSIPSLPEKTDEPEKESLVSSEAKDFKIDANVNPEISVNLQSSDIKQAERKIDSIHVDTTGESEKEILAPSHQSDFKVDEEIQPMIPADIEINDDKLGETPASSDEKETTETEAGTQNIVDKQSETHCVSIQHELENAELSEKEILESSLGQDVCIDDEVVNEESATDVKSADAEQTEDISKPVDNKFKGLSDQLEADKKDAVSSKIEIDTDNQDFEKEEKASEAQKKDEKEKEDEFESVQSVQEKQASAASAEKEPKIDNELDSELAAKIELNEDKPTDDKDESIDIISETKGQVQNEEIVSSVGLNAYIESEDISEIVVSKQSSNDNKTDEQTESMQFASEKNYQPEEKTISSSTEQKVDYDSQIISEIQAENQSSIDQLAKEAITPPTEKSVDIKTEIPGDKQSSDREQKGDEIESFLSLSEDSDKLQKEAIVTSVEYKVDIDINIISAEKQSSEDKLTDSKLESVECTSEKTDQLEKIESSTEEKIDLDISEVLVDKQSIDDKQTDDKKEAVHILSEEPDKSEKETVISSAGQMDDIYNLVISDIPAEKQSTEAQLKDDKIEFVEDVSRKSNLSDKESKKSSVEETVDIDTELISNIPAEKQSSDVQLTYDKIESVEDMSEKIDISEKEAKVSSVEKKMDIETEIISDTGAEKHSSEAQLTDDKVESVHDVSEKTNLFEKETVTSSVEEEFDIETEIISENKTEKQSSDVQLKDDKIELVDNTPKKNDLSEKEIMVPLSQQKFDIETSEIAPKTLFSNDQLTDEKIEFVLDPTEKIDLSEKETMASSDEHNITKTEVISEIPSEKQSSDEKQTEETIELMPNMTEKMDGSETEMFESMDKQNQSINTEIPANKQFNSDDKQTEDKIESIQSLSEKKDQSEDEAVMSSKEQNITIDAEIISEIKRDDKIESIGIITDKTIQSEKAAPISSEQKIGIDTEETSSISARKQSIEKQGDNKIESIQFEPENNFQTEDKSVAPTVGENVNAEKQFRDDEQAENKFESTEFVLQETQQSEKEVVPSSNEKEVSNDTENIQGIPSDIQGTDDKQLKDDSKPVNEKLDISIKKPEDVNAISNKTEKTAESDQRELGEQLQEKVLGHSIEKDDGKIESKVVSDMARDDQTPDVKQAEDEMEQDESESVGRSDYRAEVKNQTVSGDDDEKIPDIESSDDKNLDSIQGNLSDLKKDQLSSSFEQENKCAIKDVQKQKKEDGIESIEKLEINENQTKEELTKSAEGNGDIKTTPVLQEEMTKGALDTQPSDIEKFTDTSKSICNETKISVQHTDNTAFADSHEKNIIIDNADKHELKKMEELENESKNLVKEEILPTADEDNVPESKMEITITSPQTDIKNDSLTAKEDTGVTKIKFPEVIQADGDMIIGQVELKGASDLPEKGNVDQIEIALKTNDNKDVTDLQKDHIQEHSKEDKLEFYQSDLQKPSDKTGAEISFDSINDQIDKHKECEISEEKEVKETEPSSANDKTKDDLESILKTQELSDCTESKNLVESANKDIQIVKDGINEDDMKVKEEVMSTENEFLIEAKLKDDSDVKELDSPKQIAIEKDIGSDLGIVQEISKVEEISLSSIESKEEKEPVTESKGEKFAQEAKDENKICEGISTASEVTTITNDITEKPSDLKGLVASSAIETNETDVKEIDHSNEKSTLDANVDKVDKLSSPTKESSTINEDNFEFVSSDDKLPVNKKDFFDEAPVSEETACKEEMKVPSLDEKVIKMEDATKLESEESTNEQIHSRSDESSTKDLVTTENEVKGQFSILSSEEELYKNAGEAALKPSNGTIDLKTENSQKKDNNDEISLSDDVCSPQHDSHDGKDELTSIIEVKDGKPVLSEELSKQETILPPSSGNQESEHTLNQEDLVKPNSNAVEKENAIKDPIHLQSQDSLVAIALDKMPIPDKKGLEIKSELDMKSNQQEDIKKETDFDAATSEVKGETSEETQTSNKKDIDPEKEIQNSKVEELIESNDQLSTTLSVNLNDSMDEQQAHGETMAENKIEVSQSFQNTCAEAVKEENVNDRQSPVKLNKTSESVNIEASELACISSNEKEDLKDSKEFKLPENDQPGEFKSESLEQTPTVTQDSVLYGEKEIGTQDNLVMESEDQKIILDQPGMNQDTFSVLLHTSQKENVKEFESIPKISLNDGETSSKDDLKPVTKEEISVKVEDCQSDPKADMQPASIAEEISENNDVEDSMGKNETACKASSLEDENVMYHSFVSHQFGMMTKDESEKSEESLNEGSETSNFDIADLQDTKMGDINDVCIDTNSSEDSHLMHHSFVCHHLDQRSSNNQSDESPLQIENIDSNLQKSDVSDATPIEILKEETVKNDSKRVEKEQEIDVIDLCTSKSHDEESNRDLNSVNVQDIVDDTLSVQIRSGETGVNSQDQSLDNNENNYDIKPGIDKPSEINAKYEVPAESKQVESVQEKSDVNESKKMDNIEPSEPSQVTNFPDQELSTFISLPDQKGIDKDKLTSDEVDTSDVLGHPTRSSEPVPEDVKNNNSFATQETDAGMENSEYKSSEIHREVEINYHAEDESESMIDCKGNDKTQLPTSESIVMAEQSHTKDCTIVTEKFDNAVTTPEKDSNYLVKEPDNSVKFEEETKDYLSKLEETQKSANNTVTAENVGMVKDDFFPESDLVKDEGKGSTSENPVILDHQTEDHNTVNKDNVDLKSSFTEFSDSVTHPSDAFGLYEETIDEAFTSIHKQEENSNLISMDKVDSSPTIHDSKMEAKEAIAFGEKVTDLDTLGNKDKMESDSVNNAVSKTLAESIKEIHDTVAEVVVDVKECAMDSIEDFKKDYGRDAGEEQPKLEEKSSDLDHKSKELDSDIGTPFAEKTLDVDEKLPKDVERIGAINTDDEFSKLKDLKDDSKSTTSQIPSSPNKEVTASVKQENRDDIQKNFATTNDDSITSVVDNNTTNKGMILDASEEEKKNETSKDESKSLDNSQLRSDNKDMSSSTEYCSDSKPADAELMPSMCQPTGKSEDKDKAKDAGSEKNVTDLTTDKTKESDVKVGSSFNFDLQDSKSTDIDAPEKNTVLPIESKSMEKSLAIENQDHEILATEKLSLKIENKDKSKDSDFTTELSGKIVADVSKDIKTDPRDDIYGNDKEDVDLSTSLPTETQSSSVSEDVKMICTSIDQSNLSKIGHSKFEEIIPDFQMTNKEPTDAAMDKVKKENRDESSGQDKTPVICSKEESIAVEVLNKSSNEDHLNPSQPTIFVSSEETNLDNAMEEHLRSNEDKELDSSENLGKSEKSSPPTGDDDQEVFAKEDAIKVGAEQANEKNDEVSSRVDVVEVIDTSFNQFQSPIEQINDKSVSAVSIDVSLHEQPPKVDIHVKLSSSDLCETNFKATDQIESDAFDEKVDYDDISTSSEVKISISGGKLVENFEQQVSASFVAEKTNMEQSFEDLSKNLGKVEDAVIKDSKNNDISRECDGAVLVEDLQDNNFKLTKADVMVESMYCQPGETLENADLEVSNQTESFQFERDSSTTLSNVPDQAFDEVTESGDISQFLLSKESYASSNSVGDIGVKTQNESADKSAIEDNNELNAKPNTKASIQDSESDYSGMHPFMHEEILDDHEENFTKMNSFGNQMTDSIYVSSEDSKDVWENMTESVYNVSAIAKGIVNDSITPMNDDLMLEQKHAMESVTTPPSKEPGMKVDDLKDSFVGTPRKDSKDELLEREPSLSQDAGTLVISTSEIAVNTVVGFNSSKEEINPKANKIEPCLSSEEIYREKDNCGNFIADSTCSAVNKKDIVEEKAFISPVIDKNKAEGNEMCHDLGGANVKQTVEDVDLDVKTSSHNVDSSKKEEPLASTHKIHSDIEGAKPSDIIDDDSFTFLEKDSIGGHSQDADKPIRKSSQEFLGEESEITLCDYKDAQAFQSEMKIHTVEKEFPENSFIEKEDFSIKDMHNVKDMEGNNDIGKVDVKVTLTEKKVSEIKKENLITKTSAEAVYSTSETVSKEPSAIDTHEKESTSDVPTEQHRGMYQDMIANSVLHAKTSTMQESRVTESNICSDLYTDCISISSVNIEKSIQQISYVQQTDLHMFENTNIKVECSKEQGSVSLLKKDSSIDVADGSKNELDVHDVQSKPSTSQKLVQEESPNNILQAEDNKDADPLNKWGTPLDLPSPYKSDLVKKRQRLLDKNEGNKKENTSPCWIDLAYVPHHGCKKYVNVDFFKRVRARYYVFSGVEPCKEVFEALIEAKKTWEDKDMEVTIIPTYDTDVLGYWVAENEELMTELKIDLAPSANRCTINLQDHETSCAAYRLEF